MNDSDPTSGPRQFSLQAAVVAIGAAAAVLALLAALHVLSPEFSPAWRMVSEYANGRYGWVLSLMFAAWGLSSLALLVAIWSESRATVFRVGLLFLALAGAGQAIAASPWATSTTTRSTAQPVRWESQACRSPRC